jgi:hypothetical protein
MSVEQSVELELTGGNRRTRRKPATVSLCPPQIPHYLGSNPDRSCGKPATNRLELWHGPFCWLTHRIYWSINFSVTSPPRVNQSPDIETGLSDRHQTRLFVLPFFSATTSWKQLKQHSLCKQPAPTSRLRNPDLLHADLPRTIYFYVAILKLRHIYTR